MILETDGLREQEEKERKKAQDMTAGSCNAKDRRKSLSETECVVVSAGFSCRVCFFIFSRKRNAI